MEPTIHSIQAKILNVLRFRKEARFSELNVEQLTNDHFTFHINRLISLGLIEKKNGTYTLTDKGKEFANRLDEENVAPIKQGKIAVLLVCRDGDRYLVQKRLQHPYFGFFGFPASKVRWGETIFDAAKRILTRETGFQAQIQLVGIHHKIDSAKDEDVLEDKYYFVFTAGHIKGKLRQEILGGENMWMTMDKIKKLENRLSGVDRALKFLENKELTFSESEVREESY